MDQVLQVPTPHNELVLSYPPGSPERAALTARLEELASAEPIDAPCVIDGEEVRTGDRFEVRAPQDHGLLLARVHAGGISEVQAAIGAALLARPAWSRMDFAERAAVFLRAADLLAGPWRDTLNAATMLGQSKTVIQAEIDAACELIDFLRFNVGFARDIHAEQPQSSPGIWNRTDWRPLEGFVLAVSPFNFTAIAGNLPTAPALMGNTVVWKPSEKQAFAAHFTMQILEAAGLPPGVINLVHGDGATIVDQCIDHPWFAGLHFTGSATVFQGIWGKIGANISAYRTYPRIVGETGGKDFVAVHTSAVVEQVATALVRGAFEYQGQKCSAASRAYVPKRMWDGGLRDAVADRTASLQVGDVRDLGNFMSAVIDRRAFVRHAEAIAQAREDASTDILVGGTTDDSEGFFVSPTVVVAEDPKHDLMTRELFGPILTVHVYDDAAENAWKNTLGLVDTTSPYALTGAIFATDRDAVGTAHRRLRDAAGNFYVNDKPTGAVVGQQPFGGARASGTNDKAGSKLNLLRWTSPRSIKENLLPDTEHGHPHQG